MNTLFISGRCCRRSILGIVAFAFSAVLALPLCGQSQGHLIIAGGGGVPDPILRRFHELASAHATGKPMLVLIPTASSQIPRDAEFRKTWAKRGFKKVVVMHTRDPQVANRETFVKPLKSAHAVWFGGGVQGRIADAYLNTRVQTELKNLLKRGGVIGGTSAGAAIQSRIMIAGGGQEPKLAAGLGFLDTAIIDQHFLARNRFNRLLAAVAKHPQQIGIGIDEGTAIEVQGKRARVLGRSLVTVVQKTDSNASGWDIQTYGRGDAFTWDDRQGK